MTKKKFKWTTPHKRDKILNESKKAIHNKKVATKFSKRLTKNATKAELILKEAMIESGILFDFQKPFANSKCTYIVDFYFTTLDGKGFAIECDGHQHFTQKGRIKDDKRTSHLSSYFNIGVIRFSNSTVVNYTSQVIRKLMEYDPLTLENSYIQN